MKSMTGRLREYGQASLTSAREIELPREKWMCVSEIEKESKSEIERE